MLKRLSIGASLLIASSIHPVFADYSDLQTVAATVEDQQIAVQVLNPTSTAESARVQVTVRVADGSTEVLTTAPVTVPGSSTSTVSVSATTTVVAIIEDPQPIGP